MDYSAAKEYILLKLRNELPSDRTYHSLEHTLDVYGSAIDIAEQEHLTGLDLTLLKTGALFHDAGFCIDEHDHEEASCRIARERLPGFQFSEKQIEIVCNMIMCTKIPQSPVTHVEKILCDADLDYLGRNDYDMIAEALFQEMRSYGLLEDRIEWIRRQVNFLRQHNYFTRTNLQLRAEPKMERLRALERQLEELG